MAEPKHVYVGTQHRFYSKLSYENVRKRSYEDFVGSFGKKTANKEEFYKLAKHLRQHIRQHDLKSAQDLVNKAKSELVDWLITAGSDETSPTIFHLENTLKQYCYDESTRKILDDIFNEANIEIYAYKPRVRR